jgi:LuxR family maltose regulon positive regulatory protein
MPGSAEAAVVHAQLLVAKGHAREALDLLRPVHEGASSVHVPTTRVKAQVMVACLESTGGNQPRAFEALRSAVEWSSPNHFRRAFIDVWPDVAPLLAAHVGRFGTGDAFVSDMLADRRPMAEAHAATRALTDREHDILCDLPTMMTIGEIAKARGISENTVKTHVRSIYQKLGAGGRTAAVKEARARGII